MSTDENYHKTIDAIRWLAQVADTEGYDKQGRNDLRAHEMMEDRNFCEAVANWLKKQYS